LTTEPRNGSPGAEDGGELADGLALGFWVRVEAGAALAVAAVDVGLAVDGRGVPVGAVEPQATTSMMTRRTAAIRWTPGIVHLWLVGAFVMGRAPDRPVTQPVGPWISRS
jgi:hypothetical protein